MLKIFEQYLNMAEMLPILRSIAMKIIQNELNISYEEGGTTTFDNFILKVTMFTSMNDMVQKVAVDLFLDEKKLGSVKIDFDNLDDIVVEFEIDIEIDGYTFREKKFELFDKNLVVEKKQPEHKQLISAQLPK